MNNVLVSADSHYAYKDAIAFSGHKFLGGPGSPGVLIIKKKLLAPFDSVPTVPGGGTVFYVTEDSHRYLANREEREESGTPNLLGDVKLGLAVHLKQSLGAAAVEEEELKISQLVQAKLSSDPRIIILGRDYSQATVGKHLPIFSFLIRPFNDKSTVLHPNFVCALLNDLFGIQARGGCMCAGPFSQALLGLTPAHNQRIEEALLDKHEVCFRCTINYSASYSVLNVFLTYNAVHLRCCGQAIRVCRYPCGCCQRRSTM